MFAASNSKYTYIQLAFMRTLCYTQPMALSLTHEANPSMICSGATLKQHAMIAEALHTADKLAAWLDNFAVQYAPACKNLRQQFERLTVSEDLSLW